MDCFESGHPRAMGGTVGSEGRSDMRENRAAHFIVLMEVIFSVTSGPE